LDALLHPVDDAMRVLGGISRTTLWQLTKSGELQSVKIGSRVFITDASVRDYVERLSTTKAGSC
jgi:excisionase family DNA binding protein